MNGFAPQRYIPIKEKNKAILSDFPLTDLDREEVDPLRQRKLNPDQEGYRQLLSAE